MDLDEVFFRKTSKGRREQQKVAREAWLWIRVSQWVSLRELLMLESHAPEVVRDAAIGLGISVEALLRRIERRHIESPRDSRRLLILREWSHDKQEQAIFT